MTLNQLMDKVREWDFQNLSGDQEARAKYAVLLHQLQHHGAREWRTFLPAQHPDFNPSYEERLAAWISNLADECDQKLFLEYATYISFFSHDDFVALYRTAMDREIRRWVATQIGAKLDPNGAHAFRDAVYREVHHHTWFCPVTDSMDINEFYKVNHLKGIGHRPAFATLQMLAETAGMTNSCLAENVRYYMNSGTRDRLSRLVLLEDIVGSGTQCLDAVRWAVTNIDRPILFVPLILCPNGVAALRTVVDQSAGRLSVCPIIELHPPDLLGPERLGREGCPIAAEIEDLARRCSARASPNMDAFGYKSTGCSLATFANTPDNTLPIIHNAPTSGTWVPLFPRVHRD